MDYSTPGLEGYQRIPGPLTVLVHKIVKSDLPCKVPFRGSKIHVEKELKNIPMISYKQLKINFFLHEI